MPTYTAVGGVINQNFGAPAAPATVTQVYCVYWPSYDGAAGRRRGRKRKRKRRKKRSGWRGWTFETCARRSFGNGWKPIWDGSIAGTALTKASRY